jgi:O-antigen/teichoic acid export membrane protein
MDSQEPIPSYLKMLENAVPAAPTLWRWIKFAGGTTIVTVIMSAGSLASNVLVYRLLPAEQAGQFALLIALSQSLALVAGLGQHNLIRRIYSLRPLGTFDWPRDLLQTLLLVAPVAALGSFVAGLVYRLDFWRAGFVFVASLSFIASWAIGSMLASQQKYVWSNALLRLPYNLLLVVLVPIAAIPDSNRLAYIVLSQAAVMLLSIILGLLLLRRLVPPGDARIPLPDRRHGLVFLTSSVAYQLPEEALIAIAGAFMPPEQLAAVAALVLFLRLFGMSYDILSHILVTELARRERIRYRQMLVALLALGGMMSAGALLLLPFLSSWLYGGRYDAYHFLIPWLVLSAALQLMEVLPRSHILGRAPDAMMRRYVAIHALIVVLGAAVTVGMIFRWGLLGLAMGTAGLYLARNAASYYFSIQNRRRSLRETASPAR